MNSHQYISQTIFAIGLLEQLPFYNLFMPPAFGFNTKHLDGEIPLPLWQGQKTHFCYWSILVLCLQRKTSRLSHSYTDCKIWVP